MEFIGRHEIQHVRVYGVGEGTFEYVALNFRQLSTITFHDMLGRSKNISDYHENILRIAE